MTALENEEHLFARTELGYMLAYNPSSGLTMKQRNLLKMIDGRTRTALYIENLNNFGNVRAALIELESHGLIVGVATPLKTEKFVNSEVASITTRDMFTFQNMNNVPDFQHTTLANPHDKEAILRQVISEMSDFVLTHTPENALVVLKELETIGSFEELEISLGGYCQLIESAGSKAEEHLRSLKNIITSNK